MPTTITCQHCGKVFDSQRRTRRFCSRACANRSVWAADKTRHCRQCGKPFPLRSAADANRRHCSQACAKKSVQKSTLAFYERNPKADYMGQVNARRAIKNPGMWRDKHRSERAEAISLLGGGCVVCGVTNPNWLHVDYKPTTNGKPYRHPRHLKYIREHVEDFRLLCANHHYELTLTGKIAGTPITQDGRYSSIFSQELVEQPSDTSSLASGS
jgi:hypothetical protein